VASISGNSPERIDCSGELLNLQALPENVIHSIRSGLITTDLEGHIILLNAPGQKLLQRPASSLYGRHISELFLEPALWRRQAGKLAWLGSRVSIVAS
jgi:PAS domain-containing protein